MNDVREKLHELSNHRVMQEALLDSVDKMNGDNDDEGPIRMSVEDRKFAQLVSENNDRVLVDGEEPIDKILRSKQKIVELGSNLNNQEFKVKIDAICPVCSSTMSEHKIMNEMTDLIDAKIVEGGVVLSE